MPSLVRRLVFSLVCVVVAAGGYVWWWEAHQPKPVTFRTVTVTRGPLVQSVTATGGLQPVATVDVSSQISGLIIEVAVDYNSVVKTGDVLARLDPATYQSRLRQAEAELANTRASYHLARLNAERIRVLHQRNFVSQQELDQAEAQLASAEAQLQIRIAALENAKVDLSRCTIVSPIDGVVLDRPAIAGKTISATTSAPVLFVLVNDLRQMQINASVSEADIGGVREGQAVFFTVDAYPGQRFRGVVRQIRNHPVREQNVVSYVTVIDVDNEDLRLKPGMTANVSIVIQERANALLVPNAALRARIPEDMILAPVAPAFDATTSADPSAAFVALLAEFGHVGEGQPSPVVMERVRALAVERGIPVPEGRRGERVGPPAAVSMRTVYKPAGTPAAPRAQAVFVRLGITDGVHTEVLSGLQEKDELITNVISAEEAAAAAVSGARSPANPFAGPRRF